MLQSTHMVEKYATVIKNEYNLKSDRRASWIKHGAEGFEFASTPT